MTRPQTGDHRISWRPSTGSFPGQFVTRGEVLGEHCGKKFQAHHPVGRLENPYYVCGGYVSSGRNVCDGPRVPMPYLDAAVLDGI